MRRRMVLGLGLALGATALAVTAAGGRNLFYAAITPESAAGRLEAPQAHALALRGEITLVDIRRPDEWARTGTPQGGVPLDMRRADFTDALVQIVDGRLEAPIALICARGVRSARLSAALAEAGFTRILDVPEGMLGSAAGPGWLRRGLPVEAAQG